MKNLLFSIILIMSMSSFVNKQDNNRLNSASHELAQQLIQSLQQSSSEAYIRLLPSLNEFLVLMDANSKVYGNTMDEAKITFASEYNSKIVQPAKNSFNSIIEEGNKKGVDWATAKLVRSEMKNLSEDDKVFSLEITISSHGKEFTIEIEKAFFVNDRLHASQFVKLI